MPLPDYEKLGVFYLGREFDLSTRKQSPQPLLYDSKDLVTHAVCVGMTGSGKTGLCLAVLEEAAIDGIPAIVIDPKGDLGNLLLTFPELRPEDFKPWINADDARKQGIDPDAFAARQAELWKSGLAKWDESGERIARMKAAADFAIYTPGSSAGIQISILKSFDAPDAAFREDGEMFRERVATTVTSILGLLGIDADPIQSREHILLSSILSEHWNAGQNLDLAKLIGEIQQPPMARIGVLDVESFFPQKDRFSLAMRLNNLLAAPGFAQWMEGAPLDIASLLYTPQGKPRIAIFSIAHLGDGERMFFVSLLLNQILGWMRGERGTTSLRALVYMDEIFGYFPPTANPPSKQPLLTLLKQARAFGVGVMLATQNPVDLDYKGLANCGTWFIGRLQTERDKMRVLEGLEGAAAGASQKFDRSRMEQTLAGLGNRVFLMNNVHDDEPVIFESRWALSYLRGPLGRNDIKMLMDPVKTAAGSPNQNKSASGATLTPASVRSAAPGTGSRPVLPPNIKQYFLPVRTNPATAQSPLVYEPFLIGTADVYFADKKSGVNESELHGLLAAIDDGPVPVEWTKATQCDVEESELEDHPEEGATFLPPPPVVAQAKAFEGWQKAFADAIFRTVKLDLLECDEAEMISKAGESERDFRVRIGIAFREKRDAVVETLRKKYAPKQLAMQERLRKAEQARAKEQQEASSSKWTAAISVGTSILGAFLGRKAMSATNINRVGTASRTIGSTMKQSSDVARASENVEAIQKLMTDLESEFNDEINDATHHLDGASVALTPLTIRPKKTDIKPRLVAIAWSPHWRDAQGK